MRGQKLFLGKGRDEVRQAKGSKVRRLSRRADSKSMGRGSPRGRQHPKGRARQESWQSKVEMSLAARMRCRSPRSKNQHSFWAQKGNPAETDKTQEDLKARRQAVKQNTMPMRDKSEADIKGKEN